MKQDVPAKLIGYFAKDAPVCIILRRGPMRRTLMIKWRTDTDEFEIGQWINGGVTKFTMTKTGSHAAISVVGAPHRNLAGQDDKGAYHIICRPPYFSALVVKSNQSGTDFAFTGGNRIVGSLKDAEVRAPDMCPFWKSTIVHERLFPFTKNVINAVSGSSHGQDQRGREIVFEEGRIYVVEDGTPRLLLDTNSLKFDLVEPPAWALTWRKKPGRS